MNAQPDGLRGKASLRIANASALTISIALSTLVFHSPDERKYLSLNSDTVHQQLAV